MRKPSNGFSFFDELLIGYQVSIVAPEFQLLKIDASESTTSFMNPCDSYVNWWSRQKRFLEDHLWGY